ncbi:MAG: hypothetical protein AB1589_40135, partial [Cyanobacteriota bacterium]
ALNAALAIQDEWSCFSALRALAGKLPAALPKALDAALAIQFEFFRAEAITALADKLTPELLPKALNAALAIQDERSHDEALMALAGKLAPDLLPKALEAAQAIQDEEYRAKALTALAFHLVNTSNRFNLWKDLLHFLSYRTRQDLVSDLAAFTPVIIALGGEAAAAETAQAIQDVSRWWS